MIFFTYLVLSYVFCVFMLITEYLYELYVNEFDICVNVFKLYQKTQKKYETNKLCVLC